MKNPEGLAPFEVLLREAEGATGERADAAVPVAETAVSREDVLRDAAEAKMRLAALHAAAEGGTE